MALNQMTYLPRVLTWATPYRVRLSCSLLTVSNIQLVARGDDLTLNEAAFRRWPRSLETYTFSFQAGTGWRTKPLSVPRSHYHHCRILRSTKPPVTEPGSNQALGSYGSRSSAQIATTWLVMTWQNVRRSQALCRTRSTSMLMVKTAMDSTLKLTVTKGSTDWSRPSDLNEQA